MKAKSIIKTQCAMESAIDFIDCNTQGDETGIGTEMMVELRESINELQTEKERVYLNNALKRIRSKKNKS